MADVNIKIGADVAQAAKNISGITGVLERMGKAMHGATGGASGGHTPNQNLDLMNRHVMDLARNAERAQIKLQGLQNTMKGVEAKKQPLMGFISAGAASDQQLRLYRDLADQTTRLRRQEKIWQDKSADASEMLSSAGGGGHAAPERGDTEHGGGGHGGDHGILGDLLHTVGHAALGPLMGLGLGALLGEIGIKAFEEAAKEAKGQADFLPRMFVGRLGHGRDLEENAEGAGMKMRMSGLDLGFGAQESMGITRTMSEGGGTFGSGLMQDSRTAMELGRLFGVDAGGEASALGSAQRMGAFQSGEAHRFAQMLARQIAVTGLGPRFSEVQDATLMMLNRQMSTMPNASPGGVMALQTIFNKTGIAGFQGTAGAGLLSSIQGNLNNPGSEANQALDMAVFRRMGIKSYGGMVRESERGILGDPKLLPQYIRFALQNTQDTETAKHLLMGRFPELTLLKQDALFSKLGISKGHDQFTDASVFATMRGLKGGGSVAVGAAAAMGLTGNKLRKGEATMEEIMLTIGTPLVQGVGKIVNWLSDQAQSLLKMIHGDGQTVVQHIDEVSRSITGLPGWRKPEQIDMQGSTMPGIGKHVSITPQLPAGLGGAGGPRHVSSMMPPDAHIPAYHGKTPPVLPAVRGSFETYEAGGRSAVTVKGEKVLRIIMEEHGVVGDHSKRALKGYIKECLRDEHTEMTRVHPSRRNPR